MKQTVLFLHGAAKRTAGYADKLIAKLPILPNVTYKPIYYGDILNAQEQQFQAQLAINSQYRREHLRLFRPFIDEFIMDILQWFNPQIQDQIMYRVLQMLPKDETIHLVTHSWGSVIALSNKTPLEAVLSPLVKSITTLGCALQMFDLGVQTFDKSVQDKWTNFWHSDDLIGMPLNTIYGCKDIEIKDAGPPTFLIGGPEITLAGIAHNCYWNSQAVANYIMSLL